MFCHSNPTKITKFLNKNQAFQILRRFLHNGVTIYAVFETLYPLECLAVESNLINIDWIILTDLKGQLQ